MAYMVKDDHPDEIVKAIHIIIGGGHYYSPVVFKKLTQKINNTNQKGIMKLSPREIKILDLLSNGCTSDEISIKAEMSIHTVKTYRKNLMIKFNAKNVTHLVTLALKKGYLDDLTNS